MAFPCKCGRHGRRYTAFRARGTPGSTNVLNSDRRKLDGFKPSSLTGCKIPQPTCQGVLSLENFTHRLPGKHFDAVVAHG